MKSFSLFARRAGKGERRGNEAKKDEESGDVPDAYAHIKVGSSQ